MSTVSAFQGISTSNGNEAAAAATLDKNSANATATSDRFLKLLVAQLQNQDPLNPMDNAQVTSQMAQINTVSGIEKLNGTVQSLSSQFVRMQALQGAALVGHDVMVAGNRLDIADGVGKGGYELAGKADHVKLEVLNGAKQVVDTVELGPQDAGLGNFGWPAGKYDNTSGLSFRITATQGTNAVTATTLMQDKVTAVSMKNDTMLLELARSGSVEYGQVSALN